MNLMSKIFGKTAKENMEKMEVANDAEEESTEDETADDTIDDEEPDSEDDDEGGGGDEEGLYSSAQGGFG